MPVRSAELPEELAHVADKEIWYAQRQQALVPDVRGRPSRPRLWHDRQGAPIPEQPGRCFRHRVDRPLSMKLR
jgi:hypothetical protein